MTDLTAATCAAATLVGLEIAAEYCPGVLRFLETAQEMATVLDGVHLEDEDELALAPVWRLPGPELDQ